MTTADSSANIHTLSQQLQKTLQRSLELIGLVSRQDPVRDKAEELHLELQRAAALARRMIADVECYPPALVRPPAPAKPKMVPSPTPRPVLLYVDDKSERLALLKSVLEANGYDVITALTGQDGLREFLTHKIQLVILDYYMPSMNGGAVALEMRQLRSDIPIIIFSGALSLPDRIMAVIDGFINTSEEPEVLLKKIAELVPREIKAAAS